MALLIHGEADSDNRDDYQRLLLSIRNDYPELIESMLPSSSREVRGLLKKKGIQKPPGLAFAEVPILKLPKEFWDPHFEMVARKLLLAFHYQCFGTVLTTGGRIWSVIHTNADFLAGDFPSQIAEMAQNVARPVRQKRFLDDQFLVRWNVIPIFEPASSWRCSMAR